MDRILSNPVLVGEEVVADVQVQVIAVQEPVLVCVDECVVVEIREAAESILLEEDQPAVRDRCVFHPERVDGIHASDCASRPPLLPREEVSVVAVGDPEFCTVHPSVGRDPIEPREFQDAVVQDHRLGQVAHRRTVEVADVERAVGDFPDPVDVIELKAPFDTIGNPLCKVAGVHAVVGLHLYNGIRAPLLTDDRQRGTPLEDDPCLLDIHPVLVQTIGAQGVGPCSAAYGI